MQIFAPAGEHFLEFVLYRPQHVETELVAVAKLRIIADLYLMISRSQDKCRLAGRYLLNEEHSQEWISQIYP